jgi:S1-C subfamily serine protease
MKRLAVLVLAACAGAKPAPTPTPAPTRTADQIAAGALPGVVAIRTDGAVGTGFVVWPDGRIATNLHVIAGAHRAEIALADGRTLDDVEVLAVDQAHDLAVLRVPAKGLGALTLGEGNAVKAGDRVVALGAPLGVGSALADSRVSAVRELEPQKMTLYELNTSIAASSSGGPILNERGEVVGVATTYSREGQTLSFGVPISYLRPMLLSEKGTSLAAFGQTLDAALLSGCTVEEVKMAVGELEEAIKHGAPIFNAGDAQGCYELYEKTSLRVVGGLKSCPGLRETLLGGLTLANHAQEPKAKAWALRHAFDRVLGAVEAALRQRRPGP